MYQYRFSIFTATKNRGHLLTALYNQIASQTYKGKYEWVVVSDGSTDNTGQIMKDIQKSSDIPITFIKGEGGGKHVAWRLATNAFKGRYIITCDDDDPISSDMIEVFDRYWTGLEKSPCYEQFWEVRARAKYEDGRLVGPELPKPYFDSDYNEVTFKLHKGCEMVGCRKVEVLRNEAAVPEHFLFEDKCTNFSEGLRWSRAARKYKTRFVPEIVRTYTVGHDSLSNTPKGTRPSTQKKYNFLVSSIYSINEIGDYLKNYNKRNYMRRIFFLAYTSLQLGESVVRFINRRKDKILLRLAYIPARLIYQVKQHK